MSVESESAALHQRVLSFARSALGDRSPPEAFDELALALARYQIEHNPAVARLARHHGRPIESLADLPAMPADAFRRGRIAVHGAAEDVARFQTSGTTGGSGVHPFRTLETYRELTVTWGRRALLSHVPSESRVTVLALATPFEPDRRSSLGFMMHEFMCSFDGRGLFDPAFEAREPGRWLVKGAAVDVRALILAVQVAERRGEPVLLLATSFALVWLLEALAEERMPLPPGSVVMQTGGFKGRTRTLDAAELARRVQDVFAIEPDRLIGEYGMTELSSQLYDAGFGQGPADEGVFSLPPWLRVSAVDPVSLEPVGEGEAGLARFVDLGNVDSAVCVLTQDYVRCVPGGIALLGRKPRARLRGCSLSFEELVTGGRASTEPSAARLYGAAGRGASPSPPEPDALVRLEQLLDAARRATRPGSVERRELSAELVITTGLSRAGVEQALDTCLELEPSRAELTDLARSVPQSERAHVILPANVFVAAHRAIALALASSPRVYVRASRRDPALARAIHARAPGLFELVTELPVRSGDHVWAYGGDATLDELRRSLPRGAVLHAHGDGFGVELAPLDTRAGAEQRGDEEMARSIATDVAWFDQRGCLSPRFVLARGTPARVLAFAERLAESLAHSEQVFPRGRLDDDELSDATWYKECAACFGPVVRAGQGAVTVRLSPPVVIAGDVPSSALALDTFMDVPPLGRHLEVICVDEFDALLERLSPWLTCIGLSEPGLEAAARRAAPRARIAKSGAMQTPPFDGPVDLRSDPAGERLS